MESAANYTNEPIVRALANAFKAATQEYEEYFFAADAVKHKSGSKERRASSLANNVDNPAQLAAIVLARDLDVLFFESYRLRARYHYQQLINKLAELFLVIQQAYDYLDSCEANDQSLKAIVTGQLIKAASWYQQRRVFELWPLPGHKDLHRDNETENVLIDAFEKLKAVLAAPWDKSRARRNQIEP